MDSRYRRYAHAVPEYLKNRPREFVKHCLIKLSIAKSMNKSFISMVDDGLFHVKSDSSSHENYTVYFGDEKSMPSCSCPAWSELFYPCKHFFCIFEKYPLWDWESLSPLYRNSPFLTLDYEKEMIENENVKNVEPDVSNTEISSSSEENSCDINEMDEKIEIKQPMITPRDCRETLLLVKNLTYEINDSTVFGEVQKHLNSALALLRSATKQEKGITVRQKCDDKFERKRKFLDIPRKKNVRISRRYGAASNKLRDAAKIYITNDKGSNNSKESNIISEEIIIDNVEMDGVTSFTTDIPVIDIFDDGEGDDDEPKDERATSPRSLLTFGDLKLISNKRMLNDSVINAVQSILHKQYPDIGGFQDTILGQTLNFDVYQNQPFVQVLHDGNIHWVAVSTINSLPGQIFVMDSMFKGRISYHIQRQICSIMHCPLNRINAIIIPVQQQTNGIDCGIYALAFIQYLLEHKQYPTEVSFDQQQMRNHLLRSLKENKISKFPATNKKVKMSKRKEIFLEIYCTCRMIWVESDKNIFGK